MAGNNGGARPGAGRKRGVPNKASRELKEIAQQYTEEAVLTLAEIMRDGETSGSSARIQAAETLLAYGHGKPKQTIGGDSNNPVRHIFEWSTEPSKPDAS